LLPEDVEKLMGINRWLLQRAGATKDETLVQNFKKMYSLYGSWLLSPARELLLVHAVQRPLLVPKITQMSVQRDLVGQTQSAAGQTKATLAGGIDLHKKSTIKVDLLARWDEYTGTGSTPDKPTIGRAHVCELPIVNEQVGVAFEAQAQEFGDTKHRNVRYTVEATTRFREYFLTQISASGDDPPKPPFALSVTSFDPGTSLVPARQNILSTARPAAPKVQYVVPTFRWERRKYGGGAAVSSVRRGGGLRVYLEGPWYSSGEGEQLGVVLAGQPLDGLASLEPPVTQWGRDPIRDTPAPATRIWPGNFRLLAKSDLNLSLEEMPDSGVVVAGHKVKFDSDGVAAGLGARWYCDMELTEMADPNKVEANALELTDVPSYFPFIQLALARYQPDSIPGVELSRVVRTDFIQLTPDRIAVFIFNDTEPLVLGDVDDSSLTTAFGAPTATLTIGTQQVKIQQGNDTLPAIEAALNALPLPNFRRPPNKFVAIYVAGRSPLQSVTIREKSVMTSNFMAVALQRATSATKKAELDWMPVKLPGGELDFSLLCPIWAGGSMPEVMQWVGQIPLPADVATGNYRILLSETETMKADVVNAQSGLSDVTNKTLDAPRLVYVDTLEC
jgi:hypothetical protein